MIGDSGPTTLVQHGRSHRGTPSPSSSVSSLLLTSSCKRDKKSRLTGSRKRYANGLVASLAILVGALCSPTGLLAELLGSAAELAWLTPLCVQSTLTTTAQTKAF